MRDPIGTSLFIILGLAATVVAAVFLWLQQSRLDGTRQENARLTRSVATLNLVAEQNATARDVARATAQRQEKIATNARADVERILTGQFGECVDAPLPDDLRSILDGVRAQD